MVIAWSVLSILACGETNPETVVDELRAVVSVASPPEVRPAESFTFTTYLHNPEDQPVEMLTWLCTDLGEGCFEANGGSQSVVRDPVQGVAPAVTRTLSITPALAGILPETGPITATQIWTLVCEEDTCPIMDEIENQGTNDTWSEETAATLADPLSLMSNLPTAGTGMAYQLITTSLNEVAHANPTIQPAPDNPTFLEKGEPFSMEFRVNGTLADDAGLYNYISAGGFEMPDTFVNADDCTVLNGVAPEKEDEVIVWIVLVDGFGGSDVYQQVLEVR